MTIGRYTIRHILNALNISDDVREDIIDEIEELEHELTASNDFTFDLDGAEYRFIHNSCIDDIYREEIIETIKDCYNLDLPDFIEIDWDATVDNCLVDGYGHHFSSYDHSELEVGEWYIFRTN